MTGDGTMTHRRLLRRMLRGPEHRHASAKRSGKHGRSDSNPTKLIEIVEIGKQLLITRGAFDEFSGRDDVAKYFASHPAMFAGAFPVLGALN